jgi:hypothetical protein
MPPVDGARSLAGGKSRTTVATLFRRNSATRWPLAVLQHLQAQAGTVPVTEQWQAAPRQVPVCLSTQLYYAVHPVCFPVAAAQRVGLVYYQHQRSRGYAASRSPCPWCGAASGHHRPTITSGSINTDDPLTATHTRLLRPAGSDQRARGRPLRLALAFGYGPEVRRKPFGLRLAMDSLPFYCLATRDGRDYLEVGGAAGGRPGRAAHPWEYSERDTRGGLRKRLDFHNMGIRR